MPKMKPFLEWMISVFSCVMAAASWFHLMENVEEMLCWARQDFVLLGVWQVLEQVPRMSFLEEWTSVLVCCQMAASRVSFFDRKMMRRYCVKQGRFSSSWARDEAWEKWVWARVSAVGWLAAGFENTMQGSGLVHCEFLFDVVVVRFGLVPLCFGQKIWNANSKVRFERVWRSLAGLLVMAASGSTWWKWWWNNQGLSSLSLMVFLWQEMVENIASSQGQVQFSFEFLDR